MFTKKNTGRFRVKSFLLVLTVLVLGFFILVNFEKAKDGVVTVSYDGQNFSPSRVVIKKDSEVIFKNLSGKDFWPASDFHPSNSAYPEFDSKKPLTNGGEWKFKFDKVGSWGYHDHLSPFNKGTIVVTQGIGIAKTPSNCKNLEKLDYSERELCWYGKVKNEIKKGGIDKALSTFKNLYSEYPDFAQGCHDVMHLIGDEAYREYIKGNKFNFGEETSYCGYGFYHGFVEAMLYTTGDYTEVREFCESINNNFSGDIESPNAIYSCYHGIGHSAFEVHDPRVWGDEEKMVVPAIGACEKATNGLSEEKVKQCVTGVFNALGIAYSNNQYELSLNKKDPVWICRKQKQLYEKSCFSEVSIAWIYTNLGSFDYKFSEAASFIQNINDIDGEKVSMFGLSSDYGRIKKDSFKNEEMIKNCRSIEKSLFESCINGFEWALLGWGKPGEEYKSVISFCDSQMLNQKEKNDCYKYFLPLLKTIYSKEINDSICTSLISSDYKRYCN